MAEMMIVLIIIGTISGLITVSVARTRIKARDARRAADIGQIITAIELYYQDYKTYPASGYWSGLPNANWLNSNNPGWDTLATQLAPYISPLPKDPLNTPTGWPGLASPPSYSYAYSSSGGGCALQWYEIVYRPEGANPGSPGVTLCTGAIENYAGTVTMGNNARQ